MSAFEPTDPGLSKVEWERESAARVAAEARAEILARQLTEVQSRLSLLQEIAEAANAAGAIEEALQVALERICAFTGWSVGHLYLCQDEPKGVLIPAPVWQWRNPEQHRELRRILEGMRVAPGVGLAGRVYHSGEVGWIRDVSEDTNFVLAQSPEDLGLKFGLAFPLMVGVRVMGVLEFFSDRDQEPEPAFLEVMKHAGTQLGRVIERQRARQALQRSADYFRRLTDNALELITTLGADGTIRYESPSIQEAFGYALAEYRGRQVLDFVHPDDAPEVRKAFFEAVERATDIPLLTFRFRHKLGDWRLLEGMGRNMLSDPIVAGVVFHARDVTERRQWEEQQHQSQKVQAIGQLAGGVAHDFNNILTGIIGHGDLCLCELETGTRAKAHMEEIIKAAERAARLTRQLLAFSRKQMLQPRILELNRILSDLEPRIIRTLGDGIDLVVRAEPDLGRVKVDPGQVEQVVMNLVANARDAMPEGGRLTLEIRNVSLDVEYARRRAEVVPGDYVLMAITDTGSGMTPEVQSRLFEPFYTTKEWGKGTGLGLATCHGIVKQSAGHIAVYSELGFGTTFKIYLPRVAERLEAGPAPLAEASIPKGDETILVVEDEPMLRELAMIVLQGLGYRVYAASNGREALEWLQDHADHPAVDLLVTDVVMPEMGGKELAERMRPLSPRTKVLFCSGYTEDAIVHGGILEPGISFLQKPYTTAVLAQTVRRLLETGLAA
jgi:two-component system, cell cycle sensor histidine kinase and response regulator CckA